MSDGLVMDVLLTTGVPEPGTMPLLGAFLAFGGLAFGRRSVKQIQPNLRAPSETPASEALQENSSNRSFNFSPDSLDESSKPFDQRLMKLGLLRSLSSAHGH
jgi:hypothetical protein